MLHNTQTFQTSSSITSYDFNIWMKLALKMVSKTFVILLKLTFLTIYSLINYPQIKIQNEAIKCKSDTKKLFLIRK